MLLYFGSSGIVPDPNACLCDVDHISTEFVGKIELVTSAASRRARSQAARTDTVCGNAMPTKQRLDTLLADRGLFASRTQAAASVMAGEVMVGADRRPAHKPGEMVAADSELSVRERAPYVSRGGVKLANALDGFALDVRAR